MSFFEKLDEILNEKDFKHNSWSVPGYTRYAIDKKDNVDKERARQLYADRDEKREEIQRKKDKRKENEEKLKQEVADKRAELTDKLKTDTKTMNLKQRADDQQFQDKNKENKK